MKVDLHATYCIVTREPGDLRMSDESQFLHNVKKALRAAGHDVIKKRMWKDGHMVSDHQQYVRERKGRFCVYSGFFALRDASEDFNKDGDVYLEVAGNVSTNFGTIEDRERAYMDCLTEKVMPGVGLPR